MRELYSANKTFGIKLREYKMPNIDFLSFSLQLPKKMKDYKICELASRNIIVDINSCRLIRNLESLKYIGIKTNPNNFSVLSDTILLFTIHSASKKCD